MPWYQQWFGSEFYDMLYKHRDEEEAATFIDKVFDELQLGNNSYILDLACGNGRHSVSLSNYGKVVGIDIAQEQIAKAKARNIPNSEFIVHDMRNPVRVNEFECVLNLFSSFGYFDNEVEDLKCLVSVNSNLKEDGVFVQDFLNADYVVKRLKETDVEQSDDTRFEIKRKIDGRKIVKEIKVYNQHILEGIFQEKVTAYSYKELFDMHKKSGLIPFKVYGNYDLSEFDLEKSPRVILFSKKEKYV